MLRFLPGQTGKKAKRRNRKKGGDNLPQKRIQGGGKFLYNSKKRGGKGGAGLSTSFPYLGGFFVGAIKGFSCLLELTNEEDKKKKKKKEKNPGKILAQDSNDHVP